MPELLQIANVGQIVGGTAACAWTVTRALPNWQHVVAFRRPPTPDTLARFAPAKVVYWPHLTSGAMESINADWVILHNLATRDAGVLRTAWEQSQPLPPLLQWVHSRITPQPADVQCYCSSWLAQECGDHRGRVLYQGVPRPPRLSGPCRPVADQPDCSLVVGRICTPTARKWPASILLPFYVELARRFPLVWWEFVGCPPALQSPLAAACQQRATFHAAGWEARSRLWTWDVLLYHQPELPESFGRVVAEAMRCGCIPVVDAQGGFLEQLTPATGFLCPSTDDFAHALSSLSDPAVRGKMAQAAQDRAERLFSLERFALALEQMFRDCTAASRRRHNIL